MKKFIAFIVLFIIAATILSLMQYFQTSKSVVLAPTENTESSRVRSSEEVILKIGETGDAAGLKIILNDLIDDYMCGADALCPEFGGVTVNVTLDSGTETVTRNTASDEVPLEFSRYKISIPRMAPTKFADKSIDKSEYEITFLVSPTALEAVDENPAV